MQNIEYDQHSFVKRNDFFETGHIYFVSTNYTTIVNVLRTGKPTCNTVCLYSNCFQS